MSFALLDLLIGRRIANTEAEGRKLGVFAGVPAMGLDGLGSAAYGPEAALTILGASGAAGLGYIGPITWVILVLLVVLMSSYWQTIAAYPNNGGSYVVAHENLGTDAGLLAASALMIDYLLNVSVGISAGVGALTSAAPALQPSTLWLCLLILILITLMNLRGTRETGLLWSVPTYLFIASFVVVIVWGAWKSFVAHGHPVPVSPLPHFEHASGAVGVWLLLRAFASGCTAMTGVEAVSNGVSAFREPSVRHAHGTLFVIVATLGFLLFGIAHLAQTYGVLAMDQTRPGYQSVLSQLVGAVYGRGWFYYLAIGSVLCILCLSANTSFVGFPRMCRLVAQNGFLPRAFAVPGRRLVYSVGVLFLAAGSGGLIALFGGVTDRLIPLFAVGAFLSFTLSQAGMAAHWRRQTQGHPAKLLINGAGALATGAALVIIIVAKFTEGAWLTLIAIPCAFGLLKAIGRYYEREDAQLLQAADKCLSFGDKRPPIVLIPVSRWDRVSAKAVRCGMRISPDVTALHVTRLEGPDTDDELAVLRQAWTNCVEDPARRSGLRPPSLQLVRSDYRSVTAPTLRAIEEIAAREPGRPIFVLLPELVEGRWWARFLHVHRERHLRARLLRYGGPYVMIVGVPWQLEQADPEEAIGEEDPKLAGQAVAFTGE